jgi:hypothetical protein
VRYYLLALHVFQCHSPGFVWCDLAGVSIFANHVPDVLQLGSCAEMPGIAAWRVIARVQHYMFVWYRAIMDAV